MIKTTIDNVIYTMITETMLMMMMMCHLCQGVANDDIQLTIVYKNLVVTDDDEKKSDATNAKDATDNSVDCV